MNPQTYTSALRKYVASQLSITNLPELGHGPSFDKVTGTTVYGYSVGECTVEHSTPAVLDSTWRIPVSLYCAKKESTGETASAVRSALSTMAGYAVAHTSWTSPPSNLVRVEQAGGPYVGDEVQVWFEAHGQNWVAGRVDVEMLVITGLNA